ncbi:gamma-glutamylcyclotransferase-like isoform X2 [Phyllopteryx taeniolatus]|uniref:gamma-glutamylcyclotransferase-like isoform X2 n=1 Tax=Phyllopteryx taeniolatus TaxID=161469 RepID=UPI002AD3150B|nr:gamma-glutamylcyclotransferase-like isoform X2 [Phyllopteryx taeniolatus]
MSTIMSRGFQMCFRSADFVNICLAICFCGRKQTIRIRCFRLVSWLTISCGLASGSGHEAFRDLQMTSRETGANGTFAYFAFGSNMLWERLRLGNPSATFLDTARLKDYQLDFGVWGENMESNWHGGVATIRESPGSEVWGIIWTMSREHLDTLDRQEGVHEGIYSPLLVRVESSGHGEMLCKTYQMNNFHARLTSPQYKHVMRRGARQNGLPEDYVRGLQAVKTNNYTGPSILDSIKIDANHS